MDLFAGIPVSDYAAAVEWYGRLFGSPPTFLPNDNEAVWELAEHRYVFIELTARAAGHASWGAPSVKWIGYVLIGVGVLTLAGPIQGAPVWSAR